MGVPHLGYPPIRPGWGGIPPRLTPPSDLTGGTPPWEPPSPHWTLPGGTLMGGTPPQVTPPPPHQAWLGGYPDGGGTPSRVVLDTPRSVCLLRSRRRTFLFTNNLEQNLFDGGGENRWLHVCCWQTYCDSAKKLHDTLDDPWKSSEISSLRMFELEPSCVIYVLSEAVIREIIEFKVCWVYSHLNWIRNCDLYGGMNWWLWNFTLAHFDDGISQFWSQ